MRRLLLYFCYEALRPLVKLSYVSYVVLRNLVKPESLLQILLSVLHGFDDKAFVIVSVF